MLEDHKALCLIVLPQVIAIAHRCCSQGLILLKSNSLQDPGDPQAAGRFYGDSAGIARGNIECFGSSSHKLPPLAPFGRLFFLGNQTPQNPFNRLWMIQPERNEYVHHHFFHLLLYRSAEPQYGLGVRFLCLFRKRISDGAPQKRLASGLFLAGCLFNQSPEEGVAISLRFTQARYSLACKILIEALILEDDSPLK